MEVLTVATIQVTLNSTSTLIKYKVLEFKLYVNKNSFFLDEELYNFFKTIATNCEKKSVTESEIVTAECVTTTTTTTSSPSPSEVVTAKICMDYQWISFFLILTVFITTIMVMVLQKSNLFSLSLSRIRVCNDSKNILYFLIGVWSLLYLYDDQKTKTKTKTSS